MPRVGSSGIRQSIRRRSALVRVKRRGCSARLERLLERRNIVRRRRSDIGAWPDNTPASSVVRLLAKVGKLGGNSRGFPPGGGPDRTLSFFGRRPVVWKSLRAIVDRSPEIDFGDIVFIFRPHSRGTGTVVANDLEYTGTRPIYGFLGVGRATGARIVWASRG
jgi:hypothetical protein